MIERSKNKSESGFSLIEVTIAMMVLLVGLLGVTLSYSWAVKFNAGNNLRMQSLAILQQEVEQFRSAKYTSVVTDSVLLGGVKTPKTVTTADGNKFTIETTVDDDPFTANVQINQSKTLKSITISVSGENQTQRWITAIPATVTLRRVRGN
jgi:prepilin-type N-terminal cleavage/methylation domain-containing protein